MSDQDQQLTERQAQALAALRQAAEAGDAEAQYRLGMLYGNGEGVALDHARAEHWFSQAARQGHEQALLTLAWMYATGAGVEMDERRARELYLLAADHGSARAQYLVATMYRFGQHGVERDMARAIHYYQQAAERGEPSAQFALGKLLMEGKQVPRDDVVALQWLTLAQAGGKKRAEEYVRLLVQRMTPEQLQQARRGMLGEAGE
ncbi:MAG TPA: sel1 repeat family protein [Gammaproteobacteria bacterium]|nr:sel1 repeat family protein [Gammaproteobacteria bacterium]